MYTDVILLVIGGRLYEVSYSTPESLYQQNLPIEARMLYSVTLGDSYDALKAQMASVRQDAQAASDILSSGIDGINNDLSSFAAQVGEESDIRHDAYLDALDQQEQDCKFASTAYNCP
jgi:hypothetical protein